MQGKIHEAIAELEKAWTNAKHDDGTKSSLHKHKTSRSEKKHRLISVAIDTIEAKLKQLLLELRANPIRALNLSSGYYELDVKKSYHNFALLYHPDKSQGTQELFKCIQEAFEKLKGTGMKNKVEKRIKSTQRTDFSNPKTNFNEKQKAAPESINLTFVDFSAHEISSSSVILII